MTTDPSSIHAAIATGTANDPQLARCAMRGIDAGETPRSVTPDVRAARDGRVSIEVDPRMGEQQRPGHVAAASRPEGSPRRRWERSHRGARLAYTRVGRGEPLVLLHGLGHSRRSWDPVIDRLAAERDVIAIDLPGHGDSAGPPNGRGRAPADQAVAVAELLDELGLETAHVAGNSTGGWVALELGRLQRARSVAALSPAGLWRRSGFLQIGAAMRVVRLGARTIRRLTPGAPRTRLVRGLFTAQASGHPFKVPYEQARTAVDAVAAAPGFRETLRAAERRRFRDGDAIRVPVTIAFGSRDWALVPVVARRRRELPGHARWVKLPGLGHIPMLDDPETVAHLLLETSQPAGNAA